MSTERLPFGFNSLIPETYKTKAEAFAKCLQHKLLSLGGIDTSSGSGSSDSRRLNKQEEIGSFKPGYSTQNCDRNMSNGSLGEETVEDKNRTQTSEEETSQRIEKTDDSDEEFISHSESESDLTDQKKAIDVKVISKAKQKLLPMSSEDSTVDSWCSCLDNVADFEKNDSETEEVNHFASQIKGSPKIRNWNLRKLKEVRDKPWKKNSKKNYSSSTESVDSEGIYASQGLKQMNQNDNSDSESHTQYILLDGLNLEGEEVPHRILRESSSTSSLEKHFSRSCSEETPETLRQRRPKTEKKSSEESTELEENILVNKEKEGTSNTETESLGNKGGGESKGSIKEVEKINTKISQLSFEEPTISKEGEKEQNETDKEDSKTKLKEISEVSKKGDGLIIEEAENSNTKEVLDRLYFAEVTTSHEETTFQEAETLKDFTTNRIPVKKIGGVIVECLSDNDLRTEPEFPEEEWSGTNLKVVVTSVEVLEHEPNDEAEEPKSEAPPAPTAVDTSDVSRGTQTPEEDEAADNRARLRRCSSLKTGKTPPGTPGAKKIVRFADALGLDLADVRTFLDEIPKVPSSAFDDLHFDMPTYSEPLPPPGPVPTLIPLFQQPGTQMDFLDRLQRLKVCLESALVTETPVLTVSGFVRVQNMTFHKSVHVRYSLNNWESFSDLQATYVPNSCDGFSDKFSFILYGHTLKIGQRLEFALRLECGGNQYWDNNGGINYVFNCLPQSSANTFFSSLHGSSADPWLEFY